MHNTCSNTSVPNQSDCSLTHYRNMASWISNISTFRDIWTLVIAFLDGNSKIGLQQAVDHVPDYHQQPSVLSSTRMWWRRYEIDLEMCSYGQFSEVQMLRDLELTLTLDRVKVTSTYTVCVGLPACPTMWQQYHAVLKYDHLNFVKYRHSAKFELSW